MNWIEYLALAGIGYVVMRKLVSKKKVCPNCQSPLPKARLPKNFKEAFWGGVDLL